MAAEPPNIGDGLGLAGVAWWYLTAVFFGSLGSVAGLIIDSEDKELTKRRVMRYLVCGAAASIALASIMHYTYGFNFLLIAMSVFAGFKAVDVLTVGGALVTNFVRRLGGQQSNEKASP